MSESLQLYKPLDATQKEIRLLEYIPNTSASTPPAYRLITVSLLKLPRFSALSYVWGKASSTEQILLNGVLRQVTKNLASALRHISNSDDALAPDCLLWADAVCINQTDVKEKNSQVPLMGDIYASAQSVISWLGTDPGIQTAMETLQTISQEAPTDGSGLEWLRHHPDLCTADIDETDSQFVVPNSHWESLRTFSRLEYWERIWIFQEIALSRHLVLVNPSKCMSVTALEVALARARFVFSLFADPETTRPDFMNESLWKYLPRLQVIGDVSFKFVERLISARKLLSRDEMERTERPALCILAAFTNETKATDHRDFYYGLIGVSRLDLVPNYAPENLVQHVCVDYVRAYLKATRGSNWVLLFLHDALGEQGRSNYQLPSWAPSYHMPQEMQGRLRYPDSAARAGSHVFDGFPGRRSPDINGQVLRVFGANITSVREAGPSPSGVGFWLDGSMATYLLNFARVHGAIYKTGVPIATTLFATLKKSISGSYDFNRGVLLLKSLRGTLSFEAESDTNQVWSTVEQEYRQSGSPHDDPSHLLNLTNVLVKEWIEILASYEVLRQRRLFETPEGYLGLGPLDIAYGDIICVLDGATYPVALRQHGERYIFIGECFVLGLLTGEARDIIAQGNAAATVLELI